MGLVSVGAPNPLFHFAKLGMELGVSHMLGKDHTSALWTRFCRMPYEKSDEGLAHPPSHGLCPSPGVQGYPTALAFERQCPIPLPAWHMRFTAVILCLWLFSCLNIVEVAGICYLMCSEEL